MANPMVSRIKTINEYSTDTATYSGVAVKSIGLVTIVAIAAVCTWLGGYATPLTTIVTAVMGFITAMIISFKPGTAAFLAPLYAILEGMCLAAITFAVPVISPGMVINAIMTTFGIALAAAVLYAKGVVTVNERFTRILSIAMLGIIFTYIAEFILGLFGVGFPMLHQGGIVGIGFSLVVVAVASFTLFLDYEQINQSVREGLPKGYEWFCAFSLLVTLIWLYIEVLDLFRKLKDE